MVSFEESVLTFFLIDLMKGTIALFLVVDPLGNIPIFVGLTKNVDEVKRRSVFRSAILTGLVVLFLFTFAGQQILILFGISINSFMVAGGLLLLIIAVRLLVVGGWHELSASPESVGAVPIGFPLLVGPGAITTTILILQSSGVIVTVFSVLITFVIVWLILRYITPIFKILGENGSLVVTRLMAMFIAAIAIQYIVQGIKNLI
ncbi:MarC family protein [Candidatus Bathyarchaeota archaeon]|nr:MarC family protein [Candidatus Bathyarchaeota archaeon]